MQRTLLEKVRDWMLVIVLGAVILGGIIYGISEIAQAIKDHQRHEQIMKTGPIAPKPNVNGGNTAILISY